MIRIPNASPVNLFINFETNCTCYFHPNVLIYTLRNRIAYLARNHQIFKLTKFNTINTINTINNKINSNINNNKIINGNDCCVQDFGGNWKNEVDEMLFSLLSCLEYIKPQSTCTILLSLIKLKYYEEELIKPLIESFKFDESTPKSISLFFLAASKLFITPQLLKNIIKHINNTLDTGVTYTRKDIICILSAINNLPRNQIIKHSDTQLTQFYTKLMNKLSTELSICNINELIIVLESLHTLNQTQLYHTVIDSIIKSNSLMTFNNIYQIFQIINTKSKLPRGTVKLDKHGVNNRLLLHYLDKLTINELVKIINDFRIYTTDQFVHKFSNQILNSLNNTSVNTVDNKVNRVFPRVNPCKLNVLELLKYYNRRYETSVTREYYVMNQLRRGASVKYDLGSINEVSNLCGYIYQLLHNDQYNIQRCIINKHLIQHNYHSFFK